MIPTVFGATTRNWAIIPCTKITQPPFMGHGFSLHFSVSVSVEPSTVQSSPPCAGAGLSHTRYLLCSAPPQETGQSSHAPKSPHPPFTGQGPLLQVRVDESI